MAEFSLSLNSLIHKLPVQRTPRFTRCNAAAVSNFDLSSKGLNEAKIVDKSFRLLDGREVEERALQSCIQRHRTQPNGAGFDVSKWTGEKMKEAYDRCAYITSEYAKTFYLGTKLMVPEKARATWAVYVWCRRTDELVDGPNASRITPAVLEKWEERLEAIFEGRPVDILDAALSHAVSTFVFSSKMHFLKFCLQVSDRYSTVSRHDWRHENGSSKIPLRYV